VRCGAGTQPPAPEVRPLSERSRAGAGGLQRRTDQRRRAGSPPLRPAAGRDPVRRDARLRRRRGAPEKLYRRAYGDQLGS
jgi:hypothetical protein